MAASVADYALHDRKINTNPVPLLTMCEPQICRLLLVYVFMSSCDTFSIANIVVYCERFQSDVPIGI